jgi:hypothetical protein
MEAKNEPRSLRTKAFFVNAAGASRGRALAWPSVLNTCPWPAAFRTQAALPPPFYPSADRSAYWGLTIEIRRLDRYDQRFAQSRGGQGVVLA